MTAAAHAELTSGGAASGECTQHAKVRVKQVRRQGHTTLRKADVDLVGVHESIGVVLQACLWERAVSEGRQQRDQSTGKRGGGGGGGAKDVGSHGKRSLTLEADRLL